MSSHFFFSQTLKTAQAKKLCGAIMEQPTWRNVMGGSTGVVVNEKSIEFKDVLVENLGDIELPDMASFEIYGRCQVDSKENRALIPPVGGNSLLPDGMGSRSYSIDFHSGEFSGISFRLGHDNSHWHQGLLANKYPDLANRASVNEISIRVNLDKRLPSETRLFADYASTYSTELSRFDAFRDRMKLPAVPYDAHMNYMGIGKNCEKGILPEGSIHCAFHYNPGRKTGGDKPPFLIYIFIFDSEVLPQWRDSVSQIDRLLLIRH